MATISQTLRRKIIRSAGNRCGYCLTPQEISGGQMQIEHIIPVSKQGSSDENNLWLSCAWCNSFKSNKIDGVDPVTNTQISLFNPRHQSWWEHFKWSENGTEIIGLTPIGRATVIALCLNNEYILPARRRWVSAGWYPPRP